MVTRVIVAVIISLGLGYLVSTFIDMLLTNEEDEQL